MRDSQRLKRAGEPVPQMDAQNDHADEINARREVVAENADGLVERFLARRRGKPGPYLPGELRRWTIRKNSTIAPDVNIHASGCRGQLVVWGAASSFDRFIAYPCPRAARFSCVELERQEECAVTNRAIEMTSATDQQRRLAVQRVRRTCCTPRGRCTAAGCRPDARPETRTAAVP